MDQHDSKTSGVANSFTNFHSPEMPDPIGKAKSSSDSHEVISDGCTGLDRKKHSSVSDHEVNCCESAQSAATERTSVTHDHRSSLSCSKDKADDSMLLSSFSSSCSELVKDNLAEVSYRVMSRNGNQDISMKSDVSMDEDSSKSVVAPCHCKQLETESMSSNATPVIIPASSNDSCQGTSANANSCDCCKLSGTKTCTSTDFKCSPEGSGVKSSVLVVDTQNASQYGVHLTGYSPGNISHLDNCLKTVDSAGTRCDKPLEMITDSNLVIAEKSELQEFKSSEKENGGFPEIKPCFELNNAPEVAQRIARDVAPEFGTYREASGSCSSSMQGRSDETSHMSSVDSAVLDKDCSTETGSKFHLGNALDSFCLGKDEFDLKMSIRSLDTNDTSKNKDHHIQNLI